MKPVHTIEVLHAAPLDGRGHRLPTTLEAIAARDRLLAEAAATFMPGLSSRAAAYELHKALLRYRNCAWRRECTLDAMPPRRLGRLDGHCWRILRSRDYCPAERVIRRVLDAAKKSSGGLFVAQDADHAAG